MVVPDSCNSRQNYPRYISTGGEVDAFCIADIEALGGVLAEVAESARAETCATKRRSKSAWMKRYQRKVKCAVAQAYIRAVAQYCSGKRATTYDFHFVEPWCT